MSIPSSRVTRPMSSTESIIASATARDASRPYRFVITAVAPRRAEAGDLPFHHQHAQRRVPPQQAVGRPEPGEPCAKNGDVDLGRAVEWRPWCEIVARVLEPEAVGAVVLHMRVLIQDVSYLERSSLARRGLCGLSFSP